MDHAPRDRPIGPRREQRWERWRPALHVAVLLLLLVGSAVLAADAYRAHRSSAASARRTMRDFAMEAAAHLARTAEAGFSARMLRTFYAVPDNVALVTQERQRAFAKGALGWMEKCSTGMCSTGVARSVFAHDLRTDAWTSQGSGIDSTMALAIRDSIRAETASRYGRRWEASRIDVNTGGRWATMVYRVSFDTLSRPAMALGIILDQPRLGREIFERALMRGPLLASMDTMTARAMPLRVVASSGDRYIDEGDWTLDTSMVAHLDRDSELGRYRVSVGMPAGLLPAVAASENRRVITTSLAFAASALLVALAIAQTRRDQALTRLRESFVAGVSHELRTPLAQIRLYAEMLQHGFVRNEAERADAVRVIVQESSRLTHLIENVLSYSRSTSGRLRVEPRLFGISEVLTEVRQAMDPVARGAGVRLVVRDGENMTVRADPAVLAQVLINFVDNAIRHGDGGMEVTVGAERVAPHVRITVDDDGPGVPQHERARVWERFVRLEKRTPSPGNGIGLAVAADLIEGIGGTGWVEDAPGGGARFVVQVPAAG